MSGCDVLTLARPEIRALKPYASARMQATQATVSLDANESPWTPAGFEGRELNRYPSPQPERLRARLTALYGVRSEQVLMMRGSGEGIDLLLRAFCRAGRDAIMVFPPTFGLYAVCAAVQGARVIEVPLDATFKLSLEATQNSMDRRLKLLFLCSPNNPTGKVVPISLVEEIAERAAGQVLLVVDEAYIEFADAPSAASLLDRHSNLVVLRTLSKAWGLASVRIGTLLAHPEIVTLLRSILAPYPLSAPAIEVALEVLEEPGTMTACMARLCRERERMAVTLATMPDVAEVLHSQANFLAVRFHDAGKVWQRLAEAGIAVRDLRGYPRLGDALRISIGTPEQNDRVLDLLSHAATERRVAT